MPSEPETLAIATGDHDATAVDPGRLILVAGASGYVGGRLVAELLEAGYRVRCLVRTPAKVAAAPWADQVDIVHGDVLEDLDVAMAGVAAVYYLVHTIGASADWVERDRRAAENVRDAAAKAGVERIVYLGGLGDGASEALSPHLASRHEVGRVLASGAVPVTELRAAVIIGAGSASFEMLRYLVDVLPVMVTPRWVETRCQPIAVRDVLRLLVGVLAVPEAAGQVYEIGGPDVLSYREMMNIYADEAGLRKRWLIPVPVLSPSLSSHWVGLVTPLPRSLARPLVDSLINEVIVHDDVISRVVPGRALTYRQAVGAAIDRLRAGTVDTTWSSAELGGRRPADPMPTDPDWAGGTVLADRRDRHIDAPPAVVYAVLNGVGGTRGWYWGEWLWAIRGFIDQLVGGVGMRRGRRDQTVMRVGDPVDFWRVEDLAPDTCVRLHAEMKLPGEAWLEWRIEPEGDGSHVHQLGRFHPRGLWGRCYWFAVAPFHRLVFPGLLDGIADDAERHRARFGARSGRQGDAYAPRKGTRDSA
jgi:uncharacterized protein YbjT (DUF2867 family)